MSYVSYHLEEAVCTAEFHMHRDIHGLCEFVQFFAQNEMGAEEEEKTKILMPFLLRKVKGDMEKNLLPNTSPFPPRAVFVLLTLVSSNRKGD